MLTLPEVCASRSSFVGALAGVYENSAWVAEEAYAGSPFSTLTALAEAMDAVVAASAEERQLALLRAHPSLAGRAALAGTLSAASTEEQARAGLGTLSPDEMARFTSLNARYTEKFGFPFIFAVRNATKGVILAAFELRLANSAGVEHATCLKHVKKIAWMRLTELVRHVPTGKLTTHVLDTAKGGPAGGMQVTLRRRCAAASSAAAGGAAGGYRRWEWETLAMFVTNADGRLDSPALHGDALNVGHYELEFGVSRYFSGESVEEAATPFLDDVVLRFGIDNAEKHYHVPLLCSPWSYSTYRGS